MWSPILRRPSSPICATASRSSFTSIASNRPRLKGHVDSLAPASGLEFALLPPDNATGNFTKIVQRVPVKIVLDDQSPNGLLRPGMSAVPTVNTKSAVRRRGSEAARVARPCARAAERLATSVHLQALLDNPSNINTIIEILRPTHATIAREETIMTTLQTTIERRQPEKGHTAAAPASLQKPGSR